MSHRLQDAHRYDYSAGGLTLVEARNRPSRNGEQGRSGIVPQFEAVLLPPRCMGEGAAPISSLPGRAMTLGGRSDHGLVSSLPSKSGL